MPLQPKINRPAGPPAGGVKPKITWPKLPEPRDGNIEVEVGTNSHATALAYQLLRQLCEKLAKIVPDEVEQLVLFPSMPGEQSVAFAALRSLNQSLQDHDESFKKLKKEAKEIPGAPEMRTMEMAGGLAAANFAFQALTLALRTDRKFSPVEISASQAAFQATLAGSLKRERSELKVHLSQAINPKPSGLLKLLSELAEQGEELERLAAKLESGEDDTSKKLAEKIKAELQNYQDFLKGLKEETLYGGMTLSSIIAAESVVSLLAKGIVAVHAEVIYLGGTNQTIKRFWSNNFKSSASAVVSCCLLDSEGEVLAADTFHATTPYRKATEPVLPPDSNFSAQNQL